MAIKYWVGSVSGTTPASGNWSSATGWRTTSGGLTITTPPGTGDVAVFDNNSFLGSAITVTVSATTTVGSINASGITTGANGITLAGTSGLTLSGGSATGSLLNLPSSRFTWSHNGALTISGSGTLTTNNVTIPAPVSMTVTGAQPTLAGNFNGTGTFTCSGGTLTLGAYQWFCTTFTSTGTTATAISASAGGGITATANSGTVISVSKTTAQLTFPSAKPTLTLTASGTAANRTVSWTDSSWRTSTASMPGLKITNGSDTVTFTNGVAAATDINFNSFNTSGFTGTFVLTYSATNLYIYGDFVSPNNTGALNGDPTIFLQGTAGYNLASNFGLYISPSNTSVYTQVGVINCSGNYITVTYTTGSLTLNGTGVITGIILSSRMYLSGAMSFSGYLATGSSSPDVTGVTSFTYSSSSGSLNASALSLFSSVPISITGSGSGSGVSINGTFSNIFTISGSFSAVYLYDAAITNASSSISITTIYLQINNAVNIPSSSVINLPSGAYVALNPTFTNSFRVNLSGAFPVAYAESSGGNDPNFYLSGSSYVSFNDGDSINYVYCSSFDATSFTGTSNDSDIAYIKNSLIGSSSGQLPTIKLYPSATGTFTLNSCNIYGFYAGTSTQTVNLGSSNIILRNVFSIDSATLNAGTSTFTISGNTLIDVGTQSLYNVVIGGGESNRVNSSKINSISNTAQPVTVYFGRDTTFETFNLNGTAGNLVTVGSTALAQRTLTKKTSWTLANSTDGGNNTGLTFGSTGNNSYLSVSYINGVVLSTATGNMFLMF